MPMTLEELFNKYPEVEIIEVFGYDDGEPFGKSSDGRKLKILDENLADELADLPNANTSEGHITDNGYLIRGGFNINVSSYKASVYRTRPKK